MEFLQVVEAISSNTIMIVISGAVIYLLVMYFKGIIDRQLTKEAIQTEQKITKAIEYSSVKELKDLHPIFLKIEGLKKIKIPSIHVGGPVRTEMFKELLNIYYTVWNERLIKLLDEEITNDNFLIKNTDMVNKIIAESSERMLKADIPQIVIDKFWQWGTKRYEYTCSTLSDIHSTGVLKSIVEKEFAALNRYQDHVYFTLIDAENTLENLNGELTGTIYHGKPVESLRHN